jgi:GNAT superfamily N-acetyltransferase
VNFLALYVNNNPQGIISYRFLYNLYLGDHCVVDDIIVDERARRQGYGKKLLEAVMKEAKKEKVNIIKFDSGLQRKGTHLFYETCGWQKNVILLKKNSNEFSIHSSNFNNYGVKPRIQKIQL